MRDMHSYISKFIFIFVFLSSKYNSIIEQNKKFVLNIHGNSDNLNFYYINLLIGKEKQNQSFILDTTTSIITSPCNLCSNCGDHFNDYYIIDNSSIINKQSDECKSLPNIIYSSYEKNLKLDKNKCYFFSNYENEEIFGLYSNNYINFESLSINKETEEDINDYVSDNTKFQLPIGCTLKETGFLKSFLADGIIGLNNNDKSFISTMYKKELIPQNLFTLCLAKNGGYFSIGDIETKYHICSKIQFIEYILYEDKYELETEGIIIDNIEIKTKYNSLIHSGSTISYFPEEVFHNISIALFSICSQLGEKCGELKRIEGYGICSDFKTLDNYTNAISYIFPNIKINFKNYEFIWEPKNYLINFNFKNKIRICFGMDTEKNLSKIILGTNFMHGYDIIFDKDNSKIGFCEANCSRNLIENNETIFNRPNIEEEIITNPIENINDIRNSDSVNKDDNDIIFNNKNEDKNENIKENLNNKDKQYYTYLFISLIIIFFLFATFVYLNNVYYENIMSNRKEYSIKSETLNINFQETKNNNKLLELVDI